jgi:hypothetical protein
MQGVEACTNEMKVAVDKLKKSVANNQMQIHKCAKIY